MSAPVSSLLRQHFRGAVCGGTWWLLSVYGPDSAPWVKGARPSAPRLYVALCLEPLSESALKLRHLAAASINDRQCRFQSCPVLHGTRV